MTRDSAGRVPSEAPTGGECRHIEPFCIVELFGPLRNVAGAREIVVPLAAPLPVSRVLPLLAAQCPALAGAVIIDDGTRLAAGYHLNLNGRDFLGGRDAIVRPGDRLLLLVGTAGG